jgi:SAM-dependent methyltransferase
MLDLARRRAADQGLANVELVQGDAQTHPLPAHRFSAAISRFGTMFFDDPIAAFANIRRGLAPSGRLCLATWQPLAANDWLTIPGAALDRFVPLLEPDPRAPGPYAQSDPAVVTDVLGRAGFTDVQLDPATVRLTLGRDAGEAAEHVSDTRVFTVALDALPDDQRGAALEAIRTSLAEQADDTGVVHLPAGIWIISACKG